MDSAQHYDRFGPTVGVIERIEPYGLYLRDGERKIIVLIPDVSRDRIRDLSEIFQIGQSVNVAVISFVEDRGLYKGTMIDMSRPSTPDSE